MVRTDFVLYMPELPGGLGQGPVEQPVAEESGTARLPIREVWLDAMKTRAATSSAATVNTTSEQKAKSSRSWCARHRGVAEGRRTPRTPPSG